MYIISQPMFMHITQTHTQITQHSVIHTQTVRNIDTDPFCHHHVILEKNGADSSGQGSRYKDKIMI